MPGTTTEDILTGVRPAKSLSSNPKPGVMGSNPSVRGSVHRCEDTIAGSATVTHIGNHRVEVIADVNDRQCIKTMTLIRNNLTDFQWYVLMCIRDGNVVIPSSA